uniref:F-box domain-containing protein n=2 Tax=Aegilops tauschii subsp. strangulata TaxID=200361 RepID=A0A453DS62_AEGTS
MNAAADVRRRSTRLLPQIHASDGVARRRSPRLRPQAQASEEVAGVARRRSAFLRPQIHAGEEASGRSRRRRRGSSPAGLSSPLEVEDLLWEILLRLPPHPSSFPRASVVCKRWRCAVTDPRFHRRFCQHHRKPPLLGFFVQDGDGLLFKPAMGPPDRIPSRRFNLRLHNICGGTGRLLGCRHGRVLVIDSLHKVLIVIAPITGTKLCVPFPPKLKGDSFITGTVLCAAADHDHVHGSCHLSPGPAVLEHQRSTARLCTCLLLRDRCMERPHLNTDST